MHESLHIPPQSFFIKKNKNKNYGCSIFLQERSWEKLRNAVLAIQTSRPISTSLEELYQMVENLSSMGKAEKVSYDKHR